MTPYATRQTLENGGDMNQRSTRSRAAKQQLGGKGREETKHQRKRNAEATNAPSKSRKKAKAKLSTKLNQGRGSNQKQPSEIRFNRNAIASNIAVGISDSGAGKYCFTKICSVVKLTAIPPWLIPSF